MRDLRKNSHICEYQAEESDRSNNSSTDYRTRNAESIRLPGETTIDKCVRVAAQLQLEKSNGNLSLDLPNPELPPVYDEIDIGTLKTYLHVLKALCWLELAAVRTYRKSRHHALHRLYSNLEKESGVSQRVFRDIRIELTKENAQFLKRISACVMRKPKYDPREPPSTIRKAVRRITGNVIVLNNFSDSPCRKRKKGWGNQLSFKI